MRKIIFASALCLSSALTQPAWATGVPTVDVLAVQASELFRMFSGALQSKLANGQVLADSDLAKREQMAETVRSSVLSVEGCYSSTGALATAAAEQKSAAVAVTAESWLVDQARNALEDEPYGYNERVFARDAALKNKDMQPVDLVLQQASLSDDEMKVALESLSASTSPRNSDFGNIDNDMDARVRKMRHAWITSPAVVVLSQQAEAVSADEWRKTLSAMGHISEDAFANSDKLSMVEIFDYLVKSRYGGAGYYSKTLSGMITTPELLRELIRLSSINLRVNWERLELERAQALAQAVSSSSEFSEQFSMPVSSD